MNKKLLVTSISALTALVLIAVFIWISASVPASVGMAASESPTGRKGKPISSIGQSRPAVSGSESTKNEPDSASVLSQSGDGAGNTSESAVSGGSPQAVKSDKGELKGMWIAYFELANMFTSKKGFEKAFAEAIDNCTQYGVNAVFVHVRSHADAFYPSNLFPWSKYTGGIKGTQGVDPGFDPLEKMIDIAHSRGVEFHAWINPYRVAYDSTDLGLLSDDNQAKKWLTDSDTSNDTWVLKAKDGLYFNPAVPEVQGYIVSGVREIVEKYNVDGIHFDDYFYPTTDLSFDEKEYAEYRSTVWGTPLDQADWRRANVNALVSSIYFAVKSLDPNCVFGISPMASIRNNYNTVYADIEAWLDGNYVDYVMPQIYFGFEYPKEASRFNNLLDEWDKLFENRTQKLYVGLGAYRIGATDENNKEWSEHDDMLARQILCTRADNKCSGYVLYSYTTFFADDERHSAERAGVKKLLG